MPTPVSLTFTLKIALLLLTFFFSRLWLISIVPPLMVNFVAFVSRFRMTCWNLRLSKDRGDGNYYSPWGLYFISMSFSSKVMQTNSIISWIAVYTLPSAYDGMKPPESMIRLSSRSLACCRSIWLEVLIVCTIFLYCGSFKTLKSRSVRETFA